MDQSQLLPRILIVDDYPAIGMMIRDVLATDYLCDVVTSAHSALTLVRAAHYFDLVITDVEMPGMGGIELLTIVRQISPELPVIVMSATSKIEIALSAWRAGAVDYLIKPFDIGVLGETVTRALTHTFPGTSRAIAKSAAPGRSPA